MRRLLLPVFGLFCACSWAFGQAGTEKQPMEITASGETKYEDGLATAHGNVAIHTGDADIYADSATYNPKTHEVVAQGNVKIYRTAGTFMGERGPSILGRGTMPVTDDIKGVFRLDYRSRRGVAVGFDPDIRFGENKQSWARVRTYFLKDENPNINRTSLARPDISEGRYRVS